MKLVMLLLLVNIVEARDFSSWFDERGLLHHVNNPTTDSSENELLFTAEYLLLGGAYYFLHKTNMRNFYAEEVHQNRHVSHDNKTGLISSMSKYRQEESIFKVGNRWWFHPRDIVYYGYMKYGFWFAPFLPIVSLANIISCARTWKKHEALQPDGTVIKWKSLTTSGKMLAFVRNKSAGLTLTHKICTWLIKRNPEFGSWTKVAKIYFPNEGHPIPILMEEYEKGL